jgi:hypothetical protein
VDFIFLHVGSDIRPHFLVKSIRKFFKEATIIQCTDLTTQKVEGVDEVIRHGGDTSNLMTFRLEAFSLVDIKKQSVFLDTDMLVLKEFNLDNYFECDAALCKRSFGLDLEINPSFRGIDLSEYKNQKFGAVYPYLACFTLVQSKIFWKESDTILKGLDKKFHLWYGDQEALKIIAASIKFKISTVEEAIFACLPEEINNSSLPNLIHFKGLSRKSLMIDMANQMGLV